MEMRFGKVAAAMLGGGAALLLVACGGQPSKDGAAEAPVTETEVMTEEMAMPMDTAPADMAADAAPTAAAPADPMAMPEAPAAEAATTN